MTRIVGRRSFVNPFRVNESRYQQCEVTQNLSTRKNLFEKYGEKINIATVN